MFGDPLSLSGITPLTTGESGGVPTFSYGAGMAGNAAAAQSAYKSCVANGGDMTTCGANAWQAGLNGTQAVKTSNGFFNDWMNNTKAILGIATHGAIGGKSASQLMGFSLTTVFTGIIGVILIAAALFLLRSPIQVISSAIKE